MDVSDKHEPFNPWKVEDIDQFLNYCCPECDTKQKTKSEFIAHAIDAHPNSRNYLPLFDLEDEKDQEQIIDPKEENGSDLILIEDHKNDELQDFDPLDTNLSDLEFKEEIIEEGYESSFKPPKKKSRNRWGEKISLLQNRPLPGEASPDFDPLEPLKPLKPSKPLVSPKKAYKTLFEESLEASKNKLRKVHKRQRHESNDSDKSDTSDSIDQEIQKCFLCAEAFPSKLMTRHLIREHLNATGVFECHLCFKLFKRSYSEQFMYHLTKEHQIGEFRNQCNQCEKAFHTKIELERHKEIHETNSRVICDKCGKEFQTKQCLHQHLKRVHNEYEIAKEDTIKKCDKCDIEYEKPDEFNNHLKQCLDELKDFECKLCDSRWVSHLSLCHHIAVDHKMMRHICDICGHVSPTIWLLKKHQNVVHEKISKLVCHLCARQVSSNFLLNQHMISVHGIGERKFKCDQCDKSFSYKHHLNTHIESVHGNVRYNCPKCDKSYTQKGVLQSHIKSHGNGRYNCDMCDKTFSLKKSLHSHIQSVHENVRYNCPKDFIIKEILPVIKSKFTIFTNNFSYFLLQDGVRFPINATKSGS